MTQTRVGRRGFEGGRGCKDEFIIIQFIILQRMVSTRPSSLCFSRTMPRLEAIKLHVPYPKLSMPKTLLPIIFAPYLPIDYPEELDCQRFYWQNHTIIPRSQF